MSCRGRWIGRRGCHKGLAAYLRRDPFEIGAGSLCSRRPFRSFACLRGKSACSTLVCNLTVRHLDLFVHSWQMLSDLLVVYFWASRKARG